MMNSIRLPALPPVPERRLAVRLTPDALRQVRGGHPWVYAEAITSAPDGAESSEPGALAVIFDSKRNFAAIGLWDPTSPIRIRILHVGKPRSIDDDFWRDAITSAASKRASLPQSGTTGYRWIHGENDGLGGLIVDRYSDTLVVKVYSAAWLPHLESIVRALVEVGEPDRIILRFGRRAQADQSVQADGLTDGMVILGDAPLAPIEFLENGLRFGADVVEGQKTGHFLDQRDNRRFIGEVSKGANVLDVFCCTGGFSVYAASGGARAVHSVDISAPAIANTLENFARNPETSTTSHQTTTGDAFKVLADLALKGSQYDIVVIDPPSFASKASEHGGAIRAYRKLAELGLEVLKPGGRLLQASCSSRVSEDELVSVVAGAVTATGRERTEQRVFGHAVDHPVGFVQGRYLKAITAIID